MRRVAFKNLKTWPYNQLLYSLKYKHVHVSCRDSK